MNLLKIIIIVALLFINTVTSYAQEGKLQLVWPSAVDAVMYELEIATTPVKTKNIAPANQRIYTTSEVFTPGIQLNLSVLKDQKLNKLYYRVRPLNLDHTPIENFSPPVLLSKATFNPTKPIPTPAFSKNNPPLLYPVYSWLPVLGAVRYDIEIMNHPPENPNGTSASKYRIAAFSAQGGFDFYDSQAYTEAGTYYWRVIAVDAKEHIIGTYSDATAFTVQKKAYKWAVFGDSITHGGGAISNPPSDERFEYVSYLPFPVKNLGRSGDTAQMLVDRFDTDVLPLKPTYLLILGGSNSIRGGVSGESVIDSLQTIKDKCADNGITPIFLTLPPVNPERIQRVFNQPTGDNWQEELQKVNTFVKTQPYFIDIYPSLVDENGYLPVKYSQDGLHPDIAGKKVIAAAINNFLKKQNL